MHVQPNQPPTVFREFVVGRELDSSSMEKLFSSAIYPHCLGALSITSNGWMFGSVRVACILTLYALDTRNSGFYTGFYFCGGRT